MRPEETARKVIQATYQEEAGIFWTGGKDSTVMLYLMRSVYPELKNPIVLLDSGVEFPEVYSFVERLAHEWGLNLNTFEYDAPTAEEAQLNKIEAMGNAIKMLGLEKIFVAIRRDECDARSQEEYLSLREDHVRVHPILDFTEDYLWEYVRVSGIPYCRLYDEGYRSLGEAPFTKPSQESERAGRDAKKELMMSRLRDMGYF